MPPWNVPSTASGSRIFTTDGTGGGAGAIPNNASNPAAAGTVIQIFATKEALTNPPGIEDSVAPALWREPTADNVA
jgi:uncharacterized protein (TIGR03437 family)